MNEFLFLLSILCFYCSVVDILYFQICVHHVRSVAHTRYFVVWRAFLRSLDLVESKIKEKTENNNSSLLRKIFMCIHICTFIVSQF